MNYPNLQRNIHFLLGCASFVKIKPNPVEAKQDISAEAVEQFQISATTGKPYDPNLSILDKSLVQRKQINSRGKQFSSHNTSSPQHNHTRDSAGRPNRKRMIAAAVDASSVFSEDQKKILTNTLRYDNTSSNTNLNGAIQALNNKYRKSISLEEVPGKV